MRWPREESASERESEGQPSVGVRRMVTLISVDGCNETQRVGQGESASQKEKETGGGAEEKRRSFFFFLMKSVQCFFSVNTSCEQG